MWFLFWMMLVIATSWDFESEVWSRFWSWSLVVKGKILRSTKPNNPMKTMNKKTGRRRNRFPLMCVKDGIVVTKCSWKMNLVSDCVVNSWFCALARPRLWGKRAISPVTRWGEGKDSPKAKRVQINTSREEGNHRVWNPKTSRWNWIRRQSLRCVSDRNRDCQWSLRASRRKQQVFKRLNVCEKPLPRNRLWCQVRSKNCRCAFGLYRWLLAHSSVGSCLTYRATPQVTYRHCWRLLATW